MKEKGRIESEVFGRVPSDPQGMDFIHKKLVYFKGNNKFRGGLLGIKCSSQRACQICQRAC